MTSLQEAADATTKLLQELQDENARLKIENTELRNDVQALDGNYTKLQDAAGRALNERDYYMRECSILEGKFTSFCSIATEAINTHRMAPFRPNGAVPKDEPANEEGMKAIAEANGMDEGDAIPAFLTKPIITHTTMPEATGSRSKIVGPLKLKRRIVP